MTTPLCNDGCSDSVGWLPESSWPYSPTTKSTAQPIYCIGGNPKVAPRSVFTADYADARQDSSGTGRLLGTSGSITSLTGVSETSLTVSNTTAYPLDVFGFWSASIPQLSIVNDWVYIFSTTIFDTSTGTPVSLVTSTQYEYGVDSLSVNPWRHMKNDNQKFLKTLAPSATATFTIRTTWAKHSGSDPASSSNVFNSFASALRVITGNSL